MIKWLALAAVLLALIGGVVWTATVNRGHWYAGDAMRGGWHMSAGYCPQTAADGPRACHGVSANRPAAARDMHHDQGRAGHHGMHGMRGMHGMHGMH